MHRRSQKGRKGSFGCDWWSLCSRNTGHRHAGIPGFKRWIPAARRCICSIRWCCRCCDRYWPCHGKLNDEYTAYCRMQAAYSQVGGWGENIKMIVMKEKVEFVSASDESAIDASTYLGERKKWMKIFLEVKVEAQIAFISCPAGRLQCFLFTRDQWPVRIAVCSSYLLCLALLASSKHITIVCSRVLLTVVIVCFAEREKCWASKLSSTVLLGFREKLGLGPIFFHTLSWPLKPFPLCFLHALLPLLLQIVWLIKREGSSLSGPGQLKKWKWLQTTFRLCTITMQQKMSTCVCFFSVRVRYTRAINDTCQ